MKPVKTARIATVKESGRRFVVSCLEFPKSGPVRVFCKGDIANVQETANGGARWTYHGSRVFLRDEVEIEERPLTFEFVREMWKEAMSVRALRLGQLVYFTGGRTGRITHAKGRTLTSDELLEQAALAEEAGMPELASELLALAEKRMAR